MFYVLYISQKSGLPEASWGGQAIHEKHVNWKQIYNAVA